MFERLIDKVVQITNEAEDKYSAREDFSKKQQAIIDSLISVQKQIKEIEEQLAPLQAQKKSLVPGMLEALHQLSSAGVRVGNILIYVKAEYEKDPTYKQVLAKANEIMSKQFVSKLEELGNELKTMAAETLAVKTEASIVDKIKSLFGKLKSFIGDLGSRLSRIERIFNIKRTKNESEYDEDDERYEIELEDYKAADRILDLGMSKLADFKDDVDRTIDFLMSSPGKDPLSQKEWKYVEQELRKYVDSFEKENESKITEQLDENYRTEIEVNINITDLNKDAGESINSIPNQQLEYAIEFEHRSWGIKGVSIRPIKLFDFDIEIIDLDNIVIATIPVKIDFSDIEYDVDFVDGSGIYADDISINMTRDGKITNARIQCVFGE